MALTNFKDRVGDEHSWRKTVLELLSDIIAGLTGAVQYEDGEAVATPTGTAVLWNDAGTQREASAAKPLPVSVISDTADTAASFSAQVSTDHAALNAATWTEVFDTGVNHAVELTVINKVNVDVLLSFGDNALAGAHKTVVTSMLREINLEQLGKYYTGKIYAKLASASASGSLIVEATY